MRLLPVLGLTYTWDTRGNLATKTQGANTTTYTWRADNRLLSISNAGVKIFYGYNPQGQRIKRYVTRGGVTTRTHYTLDTQRPYSEVLSESTQVGNGSWNHQHNTFTPDGLGELLQSGGQTVFADAQGHTRLVIDGAGNATALSYDAFGLEMGSAATAVNHRYTGEYFDQDSGLYHLRARDYDPSIGRFISMDEHPGSQQIPLTLNKYLYGNADPVNHIDPSGNFGLGGMSFSGAISSLGTLPNIYTIASIGFDVATGNYAGAAEDLASELICAKFGKALCGLVKKQLGFFFKATKINVSKLTLGKSHSSTALSNNMTVSGIFRPPGARKHIIL